MRSIGVRERKENTSRVLRLVQEQGEEVETARRGRVIARIVPATEQATVPDIAAVWSDLDALARETAAHWPADTTAVDAVREQRRDL